MSLDTEWKKFVRRGKDIAAKIPYAQRVWGFLQPRQIPRPRGTEAFTPRIWDGQYARGDWAYMVDEHTRYAVIAWFTGQYLPPNGSLLDLGCGEGILTTAFVDLPYGRYVGVDFTRKHWSLPQNEATAARPFSTVISLDIGRDSSLTLSCLMRCSIILKNPVKSLNDMPSS